MESPLRISVGDPIGKAFNRTGRILFKPFKLEKWFVLGFCAFLAYLGEGGGGSFNIPNPGGGGGGGGGGSRELEEFVGWVKNNVTTAITIGTLILLVCVAIGLVIMWVRSRGKFMFIDGIVLNRGAVVEPWKAFRQVGNSLFMFSIVLALIELVVFLVIAGLGLAVAWPDISAQQWGANATIGLVLGGGAMLVYIIATVLIAAVLNNFVVPTMYLRNVRCVTAWRIVRDEIIRGHVGTIVLFFLMKLVLGLGVGVAAAAITCATCCIAALPYIGTVILLPLLVFMQSYTLHFIEQFGPAWQVFVNELDLGTHCMRCGYDLRGTSRPGICPDCGTPFGYPPGPPSGPSIQPPPLA